MGQNSEQRRLHSDVDNSQLFCCDVQAVNPELCCLGRVTILKSDFFFHSSIIS